MTSRSTSNKLMRATVCCLLCLLALNRPSQAQTPDAAGVDALHATIARLPEKDGPVYSITAQAQTQAIPSKVGQQPEAKPPDFPEIFREQSVLTPQGTLVVQPSFEFSHSSVNRVAIEGFALLPGLVVGAIDVRKVDGDIFTLAVDLRYGFSRRLEADLRIPYVWRKDTTTVRELDLELTEDRFVNADGEGIGDLEMLLRYQLPGGGRGGLPFFIANLRVKSDTGTGPFDVDRDELTGLPREMPTGSGFWAIEPGITTVFPSDPAVLFANVSYLWNIARNVDDFGEIDPGDAVRFSLGMGLAVNEKASISLGYEHSVVGKSQQEGRDILGAETLHMGSSLMGLSYRLGPKRSFSLSIATGVTEDSPDVSITLRLPLSFVLFK